MDSITIITDTREQAPYAFEGYPVTVSKAGLPAGDYSIMGFESQVAVERKNLDDLIGCLMADNRTRFEKELTRGRVMALFAVVIESSMDDIARGRYRSNMKPSAALQSIFAFHVRYNTSFLFCGNRAGGEYTTYSLLSKYLYEIRKRYEMAQKATA